MPSDGSPSSPGGAWPPLVRPENCCYTRLPPRCGPISARTGWTIAVRRRTACPSNRCCPNNSIAAAPTNCRSSPRRPNWKISTTCRARSGRCAPSGSASASSGRATTSLRSAGRARRNMRWCGSSWTAIALERAGAVAISAMFSISKSRTSRLRSSCRPGKRGRIPRRDGATGQGPAGDHAVDVRERQLSRAARGHR